MPPHSCNANATPSGSGFCRVIPLAVYHTFEIMLYIVVAQRIKNLMIAAGYSCQLYAVLAQFFQHRYQAAVQLGLVHMLKHILAVRNQQRIDVFIWVQANKNFTQRLAHVRHDFVSGSRRESVLMRYVIVRSKYQFRGVDERAVNIENNTLHLSHAF